MKQGKKVVLFHSDYCGAATGFGGFMRELLTYLHKTGKYELVLYSCGTGWQNPEYSRWPWKIYGAMPNHQQEINQWMSQFPQHEHPVRGRDMNYGAINIDRVIQEVKPDVYIFNQDFWGGGYCLEKKWWNKIPCVFNWTADSIPLLEEAQEKAHLIKYHRVWANFAVKAYRQLALDEQERLENFKRKLQNHKYNSQEELNNAKKQLEAVTKRANEKIEAFNRVELLRGTANTLTYKRLDDDSRLKLREKLNLDKNGFYIGFLSRNQLRKLIPNILEGYKLFKKQNPHITNTKLLFFTHWGEGWNIPKLLKDYNIDNEEVFACYKCRKTGDFFVLPFMGQDLNNPKTGDQKTLVTVNLGDTLTPEQVNEWYNLLDAFLLPITSGGQERALQEAKLCELITITNPYSCGEDNCVPEAHSIVLSQSFNTEFGSQFLKASPDPQSIASSIRQVWDLKNEKYEEYRDWGRKARQWVLDNFSIEVIGKKYEELIDSLPAHNWDFNMDFQTKNPNAQIPNLSDDREWLKHMYKNILNMDVDDYDSGLLYWVEELKKGMQRQNIDQYFRKVAAEENQKNTKINFEELLNKDDEGRRILYVMPESAGDVFLSTALFQSIKETYPNHTLYVATKPEFQEILSLNPHIDKILNFMPEMESQILMEGQCNSNGYFKIAFLPHVGTQKFLDYLHNGQDKIALEINNK